MTRRSTTSTDGTTITYQRSGLGTPLVLVHGTAADHRRWAPVLPSFEQRFTVCAVDRRGRGSSGDTAGYSVEREFDDVAAVVESLGEQVHLLGHSYGALCALEAALRTPDVRSLTLYEPGIEVGGEEIHPSATIGRVEALLGRRADHPDRRSRSPAWLAIATRSSCRSARRRGARQGTRGRGP